MGVLGSRIPVLALQEALYARLVPALGPTVKVFQDAEDAESYPCVIFGGFQWAPEQRDQCKVTGTLVCVWKGESMRRALELAMALDEEVMKGDSLTQHGFTMFLVQAMGGTTGKTVDGAQIFQEVPLTYQWGIQDSRRR